ncbi:MAG: hypothetical protein GTN60_04640 [Pseudomonas stutzeri]|nr:hypothetical protein [Stutzerimonas stutzeri]NIM53802.1 hypothetical protein [Stutzerimonas stutzeri]NIM86109.1 hypothetical protein [Stutzerimonas stutzeri]NIN80705.1 hypothetical protein [Stutzerimonas stutzeri]NIO99951.1 hypothetical protein [Stutzerimonas stutzeri]
MKWINWDKTYKTALILIVLGVPLWSLVLLFALLQRIGNLSSGELAAWVSAIGSILALAGAAYLPIWHVERADAKRRAEVKASLTEVFRGIYDDIWLLTNCFASPIREQQWMSEYIQNRRGSDFETFDKQLDLFSVNDLPIGGAAFLSALRETIAVSKRTVEKIPGWIELGFSHPEDIQALRVKRDLLDIACMRYGVVVDPKELLHMTAGKAAEAAVLIPAPYYIQGVKVYRLYCVTDDDKAAQKAASAVAIRLVGPYGKPAGTIIEQSRFGWTTQEELEQFIRVIASQMIASWDHDPRID